MPVSEPIADKRCSYDERLGVVAIEVAEQIICAADDSGEAEVGMPPGTNPAEEVKNLSYGAFPLSGSSIGLVGDQQGAGTLGTFLRIVADGTPKYFALACSHVLSCKCLFLDIFFCRI